VPPIQLDLQVFDYLSKRALAQGVSLSSLVNTLLKKGIKLIEAQSSRRDSQRELIFLLDARRALGIST
jgi:hypothetical protein